MIDEPIEVPGKFTDPRIVLTAAATRTFQYGGVEFEYPAEFGWEAEVEATHRNWTLSGNDLTVMYHVFPDGVTVEMFANAMIAQMGADKTTTSETKQRLGDQEYVGKRLLVDALGTKLTYDLYAIPGKGTRILVLLDSLDESNKPSAEATRALPQIARTFKILKSPEEDKAEK